jgi:YidC/Oxa1 family membrane protein insertase
LEFLSNNFISDFFVLVLKWVFDLVQNYSVAIIIVTILVRLLILPLDLRQKKSARKMAQIQPQIESMKKRYANNPQQLQKKQQELFHKEGVKPLAGCLPMLITMPIFFAFFGAMRVLAAEQTVALLLNAQHLGQAAYDLPSWLWVHNFWQPDSVLEPIMPTAANFVTFVQTNASYITPQSLHMLSHANLLDFNVTAGLQGGSAYQALTGNILQYNGLADASGKALYTNGWLILPILAGATLFLQQKLTMGDTPQAGNSKFMLWFFPLFSIYICATANTAFSIYWLFANIYALGQSLIVNWYYKKRDQKLKQGVIEEAT